MARAYVGLGSNLGDRDANLRNAVATLRRLPRTEVVAVSKFRDTEPVGIRDQPRFLNGAVELETSLRPQELLDYLLDVEAQLGRDRGAVPKGGPRLIDLDLLVYGREEIDAPGLRIPHPRLAERRFVLEALADLDPRLDVPGKGAVETRLAKLHSAP